MSIRAKVIAELREELLDAFEKGDKAKQGRLERELNSFTSNRQVSEKTFFRLLFTNAPLGLFFISTLAIILKIYYTSTLTESDNSPSLKLSDYTLIIPALVSLISIFFLMISYLQNKNKRVEAYSTPSSDIEFLLKDVFTRMQYENALTRDYIEGKLTYLSDLIKNQKEPIEGLSESQKAEIHKSIIDSISKNLTADFFSSLKEGVVSQIADDKKEQLFAMAKRSEASVNRLGREIDVLTRRANINLGIGSIVTITALLLLGYFVVTEKFNSIDIMTVALHFIPRLSLVIFIEFFSFFFLKLYSTSLHEIKYYQNELTNLETKGASILFAANYGTESDISSVIKEMVITERNFKLQKGETTVELERNKVENHDLKEVLKSLLGAYKKEK